MHFTSAIAVAVLAAANIAAAATLQARQTCILDSCAPGDATACCAEAQCSPILNRCLPALCVNTCEADADCASCPGGASVCSTGALGLPVGVSFPWLPDDLERQN
ncbi:hypothetical protein C8Q80DRAFT_1124255 [Daedaleopsis nitida]|nr:hypothetical protein C8Q80DRAFT_1124255 [Daedaleopsis nitida]